MNALRGALMDTVRAFAWIGRIIGVVLVLGFVGMIWAGAAVVFIAVVILAARYLGLVR